MRSCLARIVSEPQLQAWVTIDRDGALAAARQCEKRFSEDSSVARCTVFRCPQRYLLYERAEDHQGSSIYAIRSDYDATSVRRLKAGAIILRKAQTTEFAARKPSPTHNP
jgi:hypothetical protein